MHINAFFELSSNRRDIWYGDGKIDHMAGSGKVRSSWNVALLQDAVAPCYISLLLAARQVLGPGPALFNLFPSTSVPEPWHLVVQSFYSLISNEPLLWTHAMGGLWVAPMYSILPDPACTADPQLRRLLEVNDMHLAASDVVPTGVQSALLTLTPKALQITPSVARMYLAGRPQCSAESTVSQSDSDGGDAQQPPPITPLLTYCLSDLPDASGAQDAGNGYATPAAGKALQQLVNLGILPLANGSLGAFQKRLQPELSQDQLFFVATSPADYQLLGTLDQVLLHPGLPQPAVHKLLDIAALGVLNVSVIDCKALDAHLLPRLLPAAWLAAVQRGEKEVGYTPAAADHELQGSDSVERTEKKAVPSSDWLSSLWTWLADRPDVADLCSWPLLPLQGGRLRVLEPAQRSPVVKEGDFQHVTAALMKLGCRLMDDRLVNYGNCAAVRELVNAPTAGGMLEAVSVVLAPYATVPQVVLACSR